MTTASYQTPDLASVLQTLAQFTPHAVAPSNLIQPPATEQVEDEEEYEPPETVGLAKPIPESAGPQSSHVSREASAATSSQPRPVDPATITDWPSALRCVMRTVAAHDASIARIKKVRALRLLYFQSISLLLIYFCLDDSGSA